MLRLPKDFNDSLKKKTRCSMVVVFSDQSDSRSVWLKAQFCYEEIFLSTSNAKILIHLTSGHETLLEILKVLSNNKRVEQFVTQFLATQCLLPQRSTP